MNFNPTLNRYMVKTYIVNMLAILFGLLALIYLFDTIELIRRASKNDTVPLSLVLQMGLLKLPEVGQILFPFAILFSAIMTFWQLNRRSELVVLRSAGYSAWQFLTPLITLALLIGVIQISVINPLGALLISKYEQLENQYLNKEDRQITLLRGGLWLRQNIDGTPIENQSARDGYIILHAQKINQKDWTFENVTVFYFGQEDTFFMRIDAKISALKEGQWIFQDARMHDQNGQSKQSELFTLPTTLTIRDIEESFTSPEAMSFWDLPSHIQTLESTGFDANQLKVHYQNLLAQPLFLAAMILLAATVSLRPSRSGGTLMLISSGIAVGFIVFFLSSYLQALGASGQIPPALSAWSPALICCLLGLSIMMTLEDG